jgi:YgiT-type zinc finger domain-containing protein
MGSGIPAAEGPMKCVICKTGEIRAATVQAEIKAGLDRLIVSVEGEVCLECGEAYYSAEAMRYLERVRDDFIHKTLAPASVGTVYQIS